MHKNVRVNESGEVKVEDEKKLLEKVLQLIKFQDNYCTVSLTLYECHSPFNSFPPLSPLLFFFIASLFPLVI